MFSVVQSRVSLRSFFQSLSHPQPGWMFSPWIDLLVVANIGWPILAWITAYFAEMPLGKTFGFLLAYFLIMPHRWITLALVFLDPVRFQKNSKLFQFVAIVIVGTTCLTHLSMGALTLLLAIDLLWNGWHFAAQHGGIARIYGRLAYPNSKSTGLVDKLVLRTLVMYAIFRLAGSAPPSLEEGQLWLTWMPTLMDWLSIFDWAVIALPAALIVLETREVHTQALGRITYLTSVAMVYTSMIMAIRYEMHGLMVGCAAAATMFHSVEYLAIVTWHVKKSKSLQETKPFCYFVPRWAVSLLAFMTGCLVSAVILQSRFVYAWVFLNLIISFLHYAYDGLIWRGPKKPSIPATT